MTAEGENCVIALGLMFRRGEATRRHDLRIKKAQ